MTPKSANIILINDKNDVLLHLRDDKPTISYPNMWVLPGGYIEEGETPEQCIIREIKEELGVELKRVSPVVAVQRFYGMEYTFWTRANFIIEDIQLTEGQAVRWFTLDEIRKTRLGYEDKAIIEDFFQEKAFT